MSRSRQLPRAPDVFGRSEVARLRQASTDLDHRTRFTLPHGVRLGVAFAQTQATRSGQLAPG